MTFNPKKDFCDDANRRKQWGDISASKVFNDAITAAFVIQQQILNAPPDLATAASYAYRMEGAKQFAQILMNLSEFAQTPRPATDAHNLSHKQ